MEYVRKFTSPSDTQILAAAAAAATESSEAASSSSCNMSDLALDDNRSNDNRSTDNGRSRLYCSNFPRHYTEEDLKKYDFFL